MLVQICIVFRHYRFENCIEIILKKRHKSATIGNSAAGISECIQPQIYINNFNFRRVYNYGSSGCY